eukprot:TRINITY_DN2109_c0_g1_i1.p1 TRINITY_DN2109_c0_g1~~TRINITY_DN2109_c0_g1_i1.p1  ORF type:complete len:407 (+),score=74.89 TRINITY_DN2109_c0_g1_i1:1780-3000(+)
MVVWMDIPTIRRLYNAIQLYLIVELYEANEYGSPRAKVSEALTGNVYVADQSELLVKGMRLRDVHVSSAVFGLEIHVLDESNNLHAVPDCRAFSAPFEVRSRSVPSTISATPVQAISDVSTMSATLMDRMRAGPTLAGQASDNNNRDQQNRQGTESLPGRGDLGAGLVPLPFVGSADHANRGHWSGSLASAMITHSALRSEVTWQLEFAQAPDGIAYRDVGIPVQLRLSPISSNVSQLEFPRRVRLKLWLENARGVTVTAVQKGSNAGSAMLRPEECEVRLFDQQMELSVQVREVSRHHAAGTFTLCARLPEFEFVAAARSKPFVIRSKRMHAPSYESQIHRQRALRRDAALRATTLPGATTGGNGGDGMNWGRGVVAGDAVNEEQEYQEFSLVSMVGAMPDEFQP